MNLFPDLRALAREKNLLEDLRSDEIVQAGPDGGFRKSLGFDPQLNRRVESKREVRGSERKRCSNAPL